ncbi:hypothetical protein RYA05_01060 [Pseudomonas syringae pv. actinidiae]|nr:hypothetical protein [Pseudomonas syringae pv. actinidiae]
MDKAIKPGKHPEQCVRHDIDPLLVMDQIDKAIRKNEERRIQWAKRDQELLDQYARDVEEGTAKKKWVHIPDTDSVESGSKLIDDWNHQQRTYYSKVRVIELPQEGKRFVLVYGDEDDAAPIRMTGPSETLERATEWFLNGGR